MQYEGRWGIFRLNERVKLYFTVYVQRGVHKSLYLVNGRFWNCTILGQFKVCLHVASTSPFL